MKFRSSFLYELFPELSLLLQISQPALMCCVYVCVCAYHCDEQGAYSFFLVCFLVQWKWMSYMAVGDSQHYEMHFHLHIRWNWKETKIACVWQGGIKGTICNISAFKIQPGHVKHFVEWCIYIILTNPEKFRILFKITALYFL